MANLTFPPTESQLLAMRIIRVIVSVPSIIGASYIIQHVLHRIRKNSLNSSVSNDSASHPRGHNSREYVIQMRIMVGMSAMDLLFALTTVLSAVVLPKDNPNIVFASGTWTTCEAFGYLGQASSASSILCNASLALYYLLRIRYGWKECHMKKYKLEWGFHILPLMVGWVLASIPPYVMDLYNPTPVGCSIRSYPPGCSDEPSSRRPCQRGANASSYELAFTYSLVWGVFLFLVVSMSLIYAFVRSETKFERSPSSSSDSTHRQRSSPSLSEISEASSRIDDEEKVEQENQQSRESHQRPQHKTRVNMVKRRFATQACLYCLAFAITWLFGTVNTIIDLNSGTARYVPIVFLHIMLEPLQGFWNALIYLRPRYLRQRRLREQQDQNPLRRRQQQLHLPQEQQSQQNFEKVDDSLTGIRHQARYVPRTPHPLLDKRSVSKDKAPGE